MKVIKYFLILSTFFIFTKPVNAHPGRTASDGCHYCRTNCDKWGEVQDERHCHNTPAPAPTPASPPTPDYTAPSPVINTTPTCASNSTYNKTNKKCECNYGYTESLDKNYCVFVPENATVTTNSTTDVWECNEGYEEINNKCVKEEPKIEIIEIIETSETTKDSTSIGNIKNEQEGLKNTLGVATSNEEEKQLNVREGEEAGGMSFGDFLAYAFLGGLTAVGYKKYKKSRV
jgi:hypothetical protein